MSDLAYLLDPDGEVVRVITAEDFLRAGGLTDLRGSDLAALAEFTSNAGHFASVLKEAEGIVSDELVRRLDRAGKWTRHEGPYVIKSQSPTAGTSKYDNERLAAALARLVESDVIDQDAATAAIEWVHPPAPEPHWKQNANGIKALLKLGGAVADAVLSAQIPTEPPRRTAKVTRER